MSDNGSEAEMMLRVYTRRFAPLINAFRFLGFLLWFVVGPRGLRERPGGPGKTHGEPWRTSRGPPEPPRRKSKKPNFCRARASGDPPRPRRWSFRPAVQCHSFGHRCGGLELSGDKPTPTPEMTLCHLRAGRILAVNVMQSDQQPVPICLGLRPAHATFTAQICPKPARR